MILTATINEVKRRILFDNPQAVVAVKGDYEVNGVAFAFPAIYEDDFDLSTAVKTVYYKATDGVIYNHVVTATDTDTGYPLWVFKDEINKGAFGDVEFALVCDKVEGGNIVKRWVSMITAFRVQKSIEIDESEQEDNEQTYSERLAYLMTQMANMQATVSGLASGAPTAVSLVSSMTDTNKLYVYTGSESGYTAGHWYYYNGSAWADGGQYGGYALDTSLDKSGQAADSAAVGAALATKVDIAQGSANAGKVLATNGSGNVVAEGIDSVIGTDGTTFLSTGLFGVPVFNSVGAVADSDTTSMIDYIVSRLSNGGNEFYTDAETHVTYGVHGGNGMITVRDAFAFCVVNSAFVAYAKSGSTWNTTNAATYFQNNPFTIYATVKI